MTIPVLSDGLTPALTGSVFDAFQQSAGRWPDQAFLCVPERTARAYDIAAGEISYGTMLADVLALSKRYRAAGYGHGHRAGLLVENRPAFFVHWLALNALGVSVVPINPEFRVAEMAYLIENSDMCLAISLASHHQRLRDGAARSGARVAIMAPDEAPTKALVAAPRDDAPGLQTECALLYTSGTTGQPKGCILPNEYFLFAAHWYRTLGGLATLQDGRERLISPLPMVHMNAMAFSSMVMLVTGGTIILADRFHPADWWDTVRESRATVIHYLGVMPAMLIGAEPSAQDRAHSVRFGFGAGVDRRHHQAFEARFGFPLVEGWAMTETGAGACIMANHEPRKVGSNCFGRPPAGVAIQVLDDTGARCASEQPGELLVRWAGSDPQFGFFKGYLKNPAATEEAWAGGWFHTGDIVRVDADGDLHFVDRKKNVIRRSGENIAAVEVEGVLLQHPQVAAAGVAPVPDEVRGDEVMACVQLRDGAQADEAMARDIVTHCLKELAYFKAPGFLAFVPRLPLTATQKIQRGELRTLANDCVAAAGKGTCFDLRTMKKRDAVAGGAA
ncbi:MAG: AMP-binding protein [Burkholderiaceae bacterium]